MRRELLAIIIAASIVPAAIAALHVQEAKLPKGTLVRNDLRYGSDEAQAVDVYSQPGRSDAPIIVMVHGGGWSRGDKDGRGVVQAKVAQWVPRGYLFVSVNYRMLPEQDVAGQAGDVARALAYVQ